MKNELYKTVTFDRYSLHHHRVPHLVLQICTDSIATSEWDTKKSWHHMTYKQKKAAKQWTHSKVIGITLHQLEELTPLFPCQNASLSQQTTRPYHRLLDWPLQLPRDSVPKNRNKWTKLRSLQTEYQRKKKKKKRRIPVPP